MTITFNSTWVESTPAPFDSRRASSEHGQGFLARIRNESSQLRDSTGFAPICPISAQARRVLFDCSARCHRHPYDTAINVRQNKDSARYYLTGDFRRAAPSGDGVSVELDQSILLALCAMAGSVLGSMLGLGGGVFIIPLITLLLGVDPHTAIGASAVCVVTNSVVGSRRHLDNRYVNFRLAMILQSTTAAGAIIGALVAVSIDASFLKAALGLLLLYAAYSMVKGSKVAIPSLPQDTPDPMNLMYDFQEGSETVRYVPQRLGFGLGTSGFAGVLSECLVSVEA